MVTHAHSHPSKEKLFLQVICIRQERKAIAKEKTQNLKNKNLIEKLVWQEIISGPRLSKTKHALGSNPSIKVFEYLMPSGMNKRCEGVGGLHSIQ